MNKQKSYKQFFHGKGISKTPFGKKPMRWIPWSYIDTYSIKTGLFRSRRKFGKSGWAYKDMDVADEHKRYDHVHDIYYGKRGVGRKPDKFERREINKAKKKRRFYND